MDPQFMAILEDCLATVEKLLSLLELDKEDMRRCVSGALLAEYLTSTDEAIKLIHSIKSKLVVLQAGQATGL